MIQTPEDHLKLFPRSIRRAALLQAQDIRKFEIDLYWKRGAYFWAFTAVALGGYFALRRNANEGPWDAHLVACLGLVFSTAWYLVNRVSTAWQQNWEMHVDMLEDCHTGPLYKVMRLRSNDPFWKLMGPYSFSPSRINNLLSLFTSLFWVFIICYNVLSNYVICNCHVLGYQIQWGIIISLLLTASSLVVLIYYGRSRTLTKKEEVSFEIRQYNK